MNSDDPTKLRIEDCLNFCNIFMSDIKAASHEEIINTIFELALINVHYGCLPDTDLETRQVLAVYQADQALRKAKNNLCELISKGERKSIATIEETTTPIQ